MGWRRIGAQRQEQFVEGLINTAGVACCLEIHQESADHGEDERGGLRPSNAAEASFERTEPVRCGKPTKARPQRLFRLFTQLPEHAQIRLPVRTRHRDPCSSEGHRVALVRPDAQQLTERETLALSGLTEDRAQQLITRAEVVQQHASRSSCRLDQRLEPVRKTVLEGVVGALGEKLLRDLWLPSPAHEPIFSRNGCYVYR